MTKNEAYIQDQIVEAIEYFFSSGAYGFNVPRSDIRIMEPSTGAQAKHIDDFGRKPYDVAFYARSTIVIFLEIKECSASGAVHEFKRPQQTMLETLFNNRIFVPYAYNSVPFDWNHRPEPNIVLNTTHVRHPGDMESPILQHLIPPAVTLQNHLLDLTSIRGSAHHALAALLDRNVRQMNNLSSMPMMILANLDSDQGRILIDKTPRAALKEMKDLFSLNSSNRQSWLNSTLLQYGHNATERINTAMAIFRLKDAWEASQVMRPNHSPGRMSP